MKLKISTFQPTAPTENERHDDDDRKKRNESEALEIDESEGENDDKLISRGKCVL